MNRLLVSGRVLAAGFALALGCSFPADALAFEREPVTGGLVAVPDPGSIAPAEASGAIPEPVPYSDLEPAPAAAAPPAAVFTGGADDTTWGIVLRGAYFGLQDQIADRLFRQHPKISGMTYGAEYRYQGEDGAASWTSVGVAFDYCSVKADGLWQSDATRAPEAGGGDFRLYALTLTGYWNIFPTWYVHPYLGIGIGAAYAEGSYQDGTELVKVSYLVPVVHVPVGLAIEFGPRFQLAVEGRFLDGVALGGSLQLRL